MKRDRDSGRLAKDTVVIVFTQAKARGEKKKRRKTGESQRGVKVGGEMEAVR